MKIFPYLRSRFSIVTLVLLTTAIALPKSANSQQIPNRNPANAYPEEVTSRFVTSCVTSAVQTELPEAIAQSACRCMIWQFQDRYSLADFATLTQRISQDEQASREFLQIVSSCSPTPNS